MGGAVPLHPQEPLNPGIHLCLATAAASGVKGVVWKPVQHQLISQLETHRGGFSGEQGPALAEESGGWWGGTDTW